jgi:phosphatidylserine/phosphatidylglycerophosphate/cardiolipin synthase-like enzyme
VKLIVQPQDGVGPLVTAIQKARKSIDVVIFRFDRLEIERAMAAAVARGVVVRTLIAHTNHRGEKNLRKLELRLLAAGVIVARTGDDLLRYHDKFLVVDRSTLYVLGFNYTRLDIDRSRSFGIITKNRKLVAEALKLFEADSTRQPYVAGFDAFVVSPVNARERLAAFIKKARKHLLIYDPKISDRAIITLLQQRAKAGVDVRILGKLAKRGAGLKAQKYPGKRLHVRAIVRDGYRAFVGSQSLRKLELDARREVGVIVRDRKVVKRITTVFEEDWALTQLAKRDDASGARDAASA